MSLLHGRAAGCGGLGMVPDVEENAGSGTGLLVPVVADDQSEPVDSAAWNHVLRTAPVGLHRTAVDDAVVMAGPGVVDPGVMTRHGEPWPPGGTRSPGSRAEGGVEGEKSGGGAAVAFLLGWLAGNGRVETAAGAEACAAEDDGNGLGGGSPWAAAVRAFPAAERGAGGVPCRCDHRDELAALLWNGEGGRRGPGDGTCEGGKLQQKGSARHHPDGQSTIVSGDLPFRIWIGGGGDPGASAGVPVVFGSIFRDFVFKPVLRPVVRLICGLVAIPLFRFLLRRVLRVQTSDAELERDLEHWFRGALLLLAATANLEDVLFGWLPWHRTADESQVWQTLVLRLLLAVGVIESMPDEDLFGFLHRKPLSLRLHTAEGRRAAWRERRDIIRNLFYLHLRRSSPVLAIMAVVWGGSPGSAASAVGWWCYGLAIAQYLVIAMVTQRDRVQGLLTAFEEETAAMRELAMPPAAEGSPGPADQSDRRSAGE